MPSISSLIFLLLLLSGGTSSSSGNSRPRSGSSPSNLDYVDDADAEYDDIVPRRINRINSPNNSHNRNSGCPKEFGDRCSCGYRVDTRYKPDQRPKYFVDCANAGFTNTSMLEHLPEQTEVLIFTGNRIPNLKPNVFGRLGYANLEVVDLSNNKISGIDGKAFHHVDSVEILLLAHNNLSNSSIHNHPRVFSNFYNLRELYLTDTFNEEIWSLADLGQIFLESNLTSLQRLHLGQNELEVITNRSIFCQLPALRQLYIPQNRLTDDADIDTSCFQHLEVIDLRQNRIQRIPPTSKLWRLLDVRNGVGESIRIELLKNPFNCDCNLQPFIEWLRNATLHDPDLVRDNEELYCEAGTPPTNKGMHLREVDRTECVEVKVTNTYSPHVISGVLWILALICVGLVLMFVYSYRGSICRRVRPLLQPTVHGVKYTSIDRNEEAEIAHV